MENTRGRRKSKYVATCPLCGNSLLKCFVGVVELRCSRCRNMIVILIQDNSVTVLKSRRQVERSEVEPKDSM